MQKQYVQSEEAVVTRVTIGQSIGNAIANEEVEKNTTVGPERKYQIIHLFYRVLHSTWDFIF